MKVSFKDIRVRIGFGILALVMVVHALTKWFDNIYIKIFTDPIATTMLYIVSLNVFLYPYIPRNRKGLIVEIIIILIGTCIAYAMWYV